MGFAFLFLTILNNIVGITKSIILELPVIDITNPAFAFAISETELSTLIDNMERAAQIPPAALQAAA